jgi:Tfp pilus assembly protein PilO
VSDPKPQEKSSTPGRREQIRVRIEKLRVSRKQSIFGLPEMMGLAASLVLLLMVVFSYLYFLVPANARRGSAQAERDRLQKKILDAKIGYQTQQDVQTSVAEITQSLVDFENTRLASRDQGRMVLYEELNRLIRSNNLRNTSGPTYSALDTVDPNAPKAAATTQRAGSAKWQSIYPGIAINLTVEGQYQNLRRFLRDLEASKQFIIVNSVELQPSKDAARAVTDGTGGAVVSSGSLVNLHLEMGAYFRRTAAEATTEETTEPR